jgi:hypothetical protein
MESSLLPGEPPLDEAHAGHLQEASEGSLGYGRVKRHIGRSGGTAGLGYDSETLK